MQTQALARWPGWVRVVSACLLGLVLAQIWLTRPAPGLSGQRLVLLAGTVVAAAAWLGAGLPARWQDRRVRVPMLVAGIVGGCLAALISPHSAALGLPVALALQAGSSLLVPASAAIAACGLATLVAGSLASTARPGFSLLSACLALTGGLAAGLWRGQYRLRAEQAELAAAQAQRADEERVRAEVLDERARIAREIHDILAHTLGGLVVQLDAADAVLGEAGGDGLASGRRLVEGARRLAVSGLEETRQAITALRTDPVDLAEALAALAAADGGTGAPVSYQLRGTPGQLTAEARLAVYRTAQEGLANARKHAPGAAVAVELSFGEQEAVLRVANDPPPGRPDGQAGELAASGSGYGLGGLTERAELLGGVLAAGPDAGGWAVELTVPLAGTR